MAYKMDVKYIIESRDPETIVKTIAEEVARRRQAVLDRMPGAMTKKESGLLAREAFVYESIGRFLENVVCREKEQTNG